MSSQREKELKHLIYLRSELIKECKKDIKKYHQELDQIHGEKHMEKVKKVSLQKKSH